MFETAFLLTVTGSVAVVWLIGYGAGLASAWIRNLRNAV